LAITKQKKENMLSSYTEHLSKSSAIFLTQYQGIPVNEMTRLRNNLRKANSHYAIVKNTLAIRALTEVGLLNGEVEGLFEGPVGIGFCYGDPPPAAKVLVDFAKEAELFTIKGGLLGEAFLSENAVRDLADLPPLEVIQAQLLGIISAPASQLAGVVASGVRQLVNVLDAYSKLEESEAEAA
jgi:large subunit ribosomal protein L10